MPEYAELHSSAHQVERWARGRVFVAARTRTVAPAASPADLLGMAVPEAVATLGEEKIRRLSPSLASSGAARRLLAALAAKGARQRAAKEATAAGSAGLAPDVIPLAGTESW